MKILLCVKRVLADETDIYVGDGKIEKNCLVYKPNAADLAAFAEAMSLKEKTPGATLDVASVDGAAAEPLLQRFVAFGADNAWRLWDATLGDDVELNNQQLGEILAAFTARQGYDVILFGGRSEYMGSGALPLQIGCRLGIPAVANVTQIEHGGAGMRVHRMLEKGRRVVYQCAPKVILSVEAGTQTRFGDDIGKLIRAQTVAVESVAFADIGVDAKTMAREAEKIEYFYPKRRTKYVMIVESASVQDRLGFLGIGGGGGAKKKDSGGIKEGSPDKLAQEIVKALEEKNALAVRH